MRRLGGGEVLVGSDGVHIRVRASAPLGRPVGVRVQGRELRVWFPQAGEGRADIRGDGAAVRWVRLRPGYGTTGLVRIGLRAGHRLAADRVRVRSTSQGGEILLPLDAFPSLATATEEESAGVPTERRQTAASKADAPTEGTHRAPDAFGDTQPSGNGGSSARGSEPTEASPEASTSAPIGLREAGGLGTMAAMFLVVGLLGAAFAALRWARGRRAGAPPPPIEVVAARRLGPRHQLVLVRALGEEHLLSVQGSQTTCIASAPIEDDEAEGEETLRSGVRRRLRSVDLADGDAPRSLFERMVRQDAGARGAPSGAGEEAARRFGVSLLRRTARTSSVSPTRVPRAAGSEAVAGLVALRRRVASGR